MEQAVNMAVQKINALECPYDEASEETPLEWDGPHVGRCLVKACITLHRLPKLRGPKEPGGHWPKHAIEWADQLAQAELDETERNERQSRQNFVLLRPTAAELSNMDKTLEWVRDLRNIDAGMAVVVMAWALRKAKQRSIKELCKEHGWGYSTFHRKLTKGLDTIAKKLNQTNVRVF